MRILAYLAPLSFLLLLTNTSYSQDERFNAGVIAGMNFSELDGSSGTDYLGLNLGLIGTMGLSKNYQVAIEFLFSQNAEYIIPEFYPIIEYGKIRLNYIEIPIHFDWLITTFKRGRTQQATINVGIAYTRLINYLAKDIRQVDVSDQIVFDKKDAFHLQTGLTYNFTKKIGLNLKATIPISVEDWTIAARIIYRIN